MNDTESNNNSYRIRRPTSNRVDDSSTNQFIQQIKSEKLHREKLAAEQKKLLAESMDQLSSSLQKKVQETNWMFDDYQYIDHGAPQRYGKFSERHFALGRRL
jgi:hypothetical protein